MAEAAARLSLAIDRQEHVVLYGDYDVDGVTSLAILIRILRALGLKPRSFLPVRQEEGYGLSFEGIERCLAEGQPDLLMAVDCGTASIREIASLRERGIDVVVLDHHEPPPDGLPEALVVNPKLGDSYHYLCTAGLAFKLCHALLRYRKAVQLRPLLESLLDLAALGTVADVVPLREQNRLLVAQGLRRMAVTQNAGLRALKKVAAVNGEPRAHHLGYRLAPRLNAAGRLDNAQAALDLLLTDDEAFAQAMAERLDEQNRERQAVQQEVEAQALVEVFRYSEVERATALVLGSDDWHPGVIGIVAGRLARRFHRPTFVVAFDENGLGKGSGRSVEGISLVQALAACRDTLVKGGGHDMAAGITVERSQFAAFRARFEAAVRAQLGSNGYQPRLWADAEVRLSELDFELLNGFDLLEPFGEAHPQPVLLLRRVMPDREPQLLRERHVRLSLYQDGTSLTAMWFDAASRSLPEPPWDILVTIQRGFFRNEERVEVVVQDLRSSE